MEGVVAMHRRGGPYRVPPIPKLPPLPPVHPGQRGRSGHGGHFGYRARPPFPPYRHRRVARRRVPRVVLPVLFVAVGVVGVTLLMSALAMLFTLALVAGTIAVPVLIVRSVRRSVRGNRGQQLARSGWPPGPAPMLAAPDQWRQAKSRFAVLRTEYAAYECDALAVLRLPALADVTVPSTARFVEAFAEAQALDTDGPTPPPVPHRDRFVAVVDQACRAWQAAREAAERIRLSNLPAEERATVERVVRLLTIARDTDNDAERLVAYGKARSELAKLERAGHVRIPAPAQAMLDNAYRGQLPA